MPKILAKFYDEGISFEGFLIFDEEKEMLKAMELLEKYRKECEDYNWSDFVQILRDNNIVFEAPPVEKFCF